jgi:F-type H+-transporting ATPase subunit c
MDSLALAYLAAGIGAAGAVIGAGLGIGKLAAAAMDGIARQPEADGSIRGAMILTAALIEGVAVIALVVCLMLTLK